MKTATQTERLIAYVKANPGVTGMELIQALALPKYTSRISDARALGVDIECFARKDGRRGYRIVKPPTHGWDCVCLDGSTCEYVQEALGL